jgi:hypothetical protein
LLILAAAISSSELHTHLISLYTSPRVCVCA